MKIESLLIPEPMNILSHNGEIIKVWKGNENEKELGFRVITVEKPKDKEV